MVSKNIRFALCNITYENNLFFGMVQKNCRHRSNRQ